MATRVLNYKRVTRFNGRIDQYNSNYREPSTVDQFYKQECICSDDGERCVAYCDPIYILFNDQRLKQLGVDSALKYLESLQNYKQSPLSELRKQVSDDDLLNLLKSRHLQSPSEIMAYARYINECTDNLSKEVETAKEELAKQAAEEAAKQAAEEAAKQAAESTTKEVANNVSV